jgi:hypothetical protein
VSGQPLRDLLDRDVWSDRDLATLEQLLTAGGERP